jgi:integrase
MVMLMASIHKQVGKSCWFCAFTIFDAETHTGKRVFRSTKMRDEKQANEVCRAWGKASEKAREGELTKSKANDIIEQAVKDVLDAANRKKTGKQIVRSESFVREVVSGAIDDIYKRLTFESLKRQTIREWCAEWLETKSVKTKRSTHARYQSIINRFLDFLGTEKGKRDLRALHDGEIERFHVREAKELSDATADLSLKVLRMCFEKAVDKRLLMVNPAKSVEVIGSNGDSKRRAFTLPEIKRILKACHNDIEWRGLVLFGLYLGQRLGDLAKLTWRAVNLETAEVAFTARKTGRRIVLPLVQPLADYLTSLPASDDPDAFIFPNVARHKRTASLSNQFRGILVDAGLAEPRGHESTGKGRSSAREMSEISFHSLRHSAVTMLKAAGVSDFVAREVVGHDSAAVSRQYSHLTTGDLRSAMQRLPDVTEH